MSVVIRLLPNIFLWLALAVVLLIWWNRRRGRAVGLWAWVGLALLWLLFTRPLAADLFRDTPTQIRPHAKTAVYWVEMRRRNEDIRSLACQPRSAQGGRDMCRPGQRRSLHMTM